MTRLSPNSLPTYSQPPEPRGGGQERWTPSLPRLRLRTISPSGRRTETSTCSPSWRQRCVCTEADRSRRADGFQRWPGGWFGIGGCWPDLPPTSLCDPDLIAFVIWSEAGEPGTTNAGTSWGTARIATASTTRTPAVANLAPRPQGPTFSSATSTAISPVQVRLITPSANSAAIRAQELPRHHPPLCRPTTKAPCRVLCCEVSKSRSGSRHLNREARLSREGSTGQAR